MDMRGLAHFIRDVRKATGNRREEENRVEEELAKMRAKFIKNEHMSTYDQKKSVCKLMFISMLGYRIPFGHMEGIKLMAEKTPAEKLIGYLAAAVLLTENSELLTLTTHTVYRDLLSGDDLNRGLALSLTANTGGKEFAEVMHEGVQAIVLDEGIDQHVRKKALLTLLRVHQREPALVDLTAVVPVAAEMLLCGQDGVSMCAVEFLTGCISKPTEYLFVGVPAKLIEALSRIIIEKETEPGYVYYGVPAPWLQCKILRFLQYFPIPSDPVLHDRAILILRKIIKATEKVLRDAQTQQKQRGAQNRVSVMNAVLFEVVSLAIQWEVGAKVITECVSVISNFIADKREANLRYIGLALLSRLSFVKGVPEFDFEAQCRQYQQQIVVGLHDADVSVRRKALEVLVAMCNQANAADIIRELLTYLPIVSDATFKGNLVLAIALLSEKYCDDTNMYVDILLTVVAQAGDFCPPDVAYRVVHVIVNNPSVQKRAANYLFGVLRGRKVIREMLLQVAAFVLGEFGYQIALNAESTPHHQIATLTAQLDEHADDAVTRAAILAALVKFYNLYDDAAVRARIVETLTGYRTSADPELQQRAVEAIALVEYGSKELIERVLEPMPAFPEDAGVALARLRRMCNMHDLWADKLIAREGAKETKAAEAGGKKARAGKGKAKGGQGGGRAVKLSEVYSVTAAAAAAAQAGGGESPEARRLDALLAASEALGGGAEAERAAYAAHRRLFAGLLSRPDDGLLFADAAVEVRCRASFHRADCRLIVTVTNKTAAALPGVLLELLGSEAGLLIQMRPHNDDKDGEQQQQQGRELPPGGSLVLDVAARSLAAFRAAPSVRLLHGAGPAATVHTLSLPVVTARFVAPYEADSPQDSDRLMAVARRAAQPLTRTLTAATLTTQAAVAAALAAQGLRTRTTAQGTLIGLGAHTTQPRERVLYAPVVCEVAQTSGATLLTVHAADPVLQQGMLDLIALLL